MIFYLKCRLLWNRKSGIPGVDGSGHGFRSFLRIPGKIRVFGGFRSPCEFLAMGLELD